MKSLTAGAVVAALFSSGATAFPAAALQATAETALDIELARRAAAPEGPVQGGYLYPKPGFNAKEQYVSTSGKYKWVAPGPTDARGPCPGLNALANHGYLPHNGVGTIEQFVESTYAGFGMGRDLGAFLGVYGSLFDGNLAMWSIGGPSPNLPVTSGLLGTPTGMSGSHNKYENDASPIRGDLYTYGNDYLNQVENFQQFIDIHKGVSNDVVNYDMLDIQNFRAARFQHSIETNPYFFNGPFSGAVASTAAYSFMFRYMANKSEEYPEGRLSRTELQAFYSMSGDDGNYKYTPGYERFPENWYKRALSDPYGIPFLALDGVEQEVITNPQFLSVGGNTGTVNSFAGVSPDNITGGVYHLSDLKDPEAFQCFIFRGVEEVTPDLLEGVLTDVTPAKNALSDAVAKVLAGKNCQKLANLQYGQFGKFPGFSKDYSGYTAPKKGLLSGILS